MAEPTSHNERIVTPERERRGAVPERDTAKAIAGTGVTEAIAGAAGVILAVLGLIGVLQLYMAAIAAICVGAALLIEGLGIGSRIKAMRHGMGGDRAAMGGLAGGTSVEVLGGIAGIVLGVLALFDVLPGEMLAIAALVYGATLILGSGATRQLDASLAIRDDQSQAAHQALVTSDGAKILAGLAAAALGILFLADVITAIEALLVAFLVVGAVNLLSGGALSARMTPLLH